MSGSWNLYMHSRIWPDPKRCWGSPAGIKPAKLCSLDALLKECLFMLEICEQAYASILYQTMLEAVEKQTIN